MTHEDWEFRFKALSAVATVVTAFSIVIGGLSALYTYKKQAQAQVEQKEKELRQIRYSQKRDVYYELADAAAAVATSNNPAEALVNATKYYRLYYGKAHIFAIDVSVSNAKIEFRKRLDEALSRGQWPSTELKSETLALTDACKTILRKEEEAVTAIPGV
jgi:hypothetical protein